MTAPCPAFGFVVEMELAAAAAPDAGDALRDAWLAFLEGRGLYCGGGWGRRDGGGPARLEYVVASEAAQATDSDRAAARAWLASRSQLRAWRVGELEDLNQAV